MPVEVATYINDLNALNPLATDVKSQGDDHLRLIKAVLLATFPDGSAPYRREYVATKWGIGTTTTPHGGVGVGIVAVDGVDASTSGPHAQFTTAADNYPLLQLLNWSHDNVGIALDSYFDGTNWKSSDAGSNFRLYKLSDVLRIDFESGIAQGSNVTWDIGVQMDASGNVGVGAAPSFKLTVAGAVGPATNDAGALGSASLSFSDLFLASGGLLNWANGDVVVTHSTGVVTVSTGDLRITTAGANAASVVTVGGVQTLTGKTLASPILTGIPTAPTAGPSTNDTQIATTAFVATAIGGIGVAGWDSADDIPFVATGGIAATNVQAAVAEVDSEKAPKANATFTGTFAVPNDVITYAMMQNVASNDRILGRVSGAGGDVEELTAAQVKTLLAVAQADVSGLTTGASPQFAALNLGHASDTTLARVSAGVVAIEGSNILLASGLGSITQAYDADTLKRDESLTLTVGYPITPANAGTKSSGTFTPSIASGNLQYATNNGAHTLAAPTADGTIAILYTNGASAGTITFSGFTVGSAVGDALTTTNTSRFLITIVRINSVATYTVKALQ